MKRGNVLGIDFLRLKNFHGFSNRIIEQTFLAVARIVIALRCQFLVEFPNHAGLLPQGWNPSTFLPSWRIPSLGVDDIDDIVLNSVLSASIFVLVRPILYCTFQLGDDPCQIPGTDGARFAVTSLGELVLHLAAKPASCREILLRNPSMAHCLWLVAVPSGIPSGTANLHGARFAVTSPDCVSPAPAPRGPRSTADAFRTRPPVQNTWRLA